MPEPSPLLLDACGALNLAAAMPLAGASSELGRRLLITEQAAAEVLYLEDEDDVGDLIRIRVHLAGVEVISLTPSELQVYVDLAVELDDGEASTIAAASKRGWPMWTDDRKALRVARQRRPPVEAVSTAAVFRTWARLRGLSESEVGAVLARVERRAIFVPRRSDPDYEWWIRCTNPPMP